MTRFVIGQLAIVVIAAAAALSGCVTVVPAPTAPQASVAEAEQPEQEIQRINDTIACTHFKHNLTQFNSLVGPNASNGDWIKAFEGLAFAASDRASEASDESSAEVSFQRLATFAAGFADEMRETAGLSTQSKLEYRNAFAAVGVACGEKYIVR